MVGGVRAGILGGEVASAVVERASLRFALLLLTLSGAVAATPAAAYVGAEGRLAADRLVTSQTVVGDWGEPTFVGEAIAGLVNAHKHFGDNAYLTAAEGGANFVLNRDGYNGTTYTGGFLPFPPETYALARLAQSNPATWLAPASTVFSQARTDFGSASAYVTATIDFHLINLGNPIHNAVYDLARLAIAASLVNDVDAGIYRTAVIDNLADVDDNGSDPSVFALGAAVFALASTGPLDGTSLSGTSTVLNGRTLADLPGLLAGHQVTDGNDGTIGDFYWRFDHIGAPPSGVTETTTLAVLGLKISQDMDPSTFSFTSEVSAARSVLAAGVGPIGQVYYIGGNSTSGAGYVYAGETLEALPEPTTLLMVGTAISVLATGRRTQLNRIESEFTDVAV